MPRSHPPKTITLLLPSTSPASADQRYSTLAIEPKLPTESADPPSLEVLLLAEKLAKRRGHQFDIESFMTPLQRHQYRAMRSESIHSPQPSDDGGDASGGLSEVTLGKRPSNEGEDPLRGPSTPNGTLLPSLPSTPASTADSPVFKKPRLMPNLSHLHWKVRQKKLKELALQDGLPGLPDGFSGYPTTPIDSNTSAQPVSIAGSTGVNIVTGGRGGNVDKAGIQASASYWNHLLIQARKDRGPQWDYNSQTYQIDRSTKDYYSHMTSPPSDPVELPPEAKIEVDQPAASTTINLSSLRRASASAPSSEERKGSVSAAAGTPGIVPPEAYHLQNQPLPPGPQRGRPSLTPQTTPQGAFPSPAGSTATLGQSADGAGAGQSQGMPNQPGQPPGQAGQGNFQRRPSMGSNPQQVQLPNRPPPVTATAAGPPPGMAGPPSMSFMGYQQPGPGYNPTLPTQSQQTQQFQQARPMGPPGMPGMQGMQGMQGMNMTPAMLANIRASMQQGQGMGQAMGMAQGQMGQGQGMGMGMGQMGQMGQTGMGVGMGMNMSGMGGTGMGGMNMGQMGQMGQMGMGMNPLGMNGMGMGPPGGGGINPAALGMGRPGMPQPQTASAQGQGPMLGGGSNWDFNS